MKYVQVPNIGLPVSRIAYGTTGFDGIFPVDQGLRLMARFLELGGNMVDTAHCYGFWAPNGLGASERFVGAVAREFGRETLVVATKGGHIGVGDGYPRPDDFMRPELVAQDLNESLDRLEMDQVDLFYLHRDDPRIPTSEIISAANDLIKSGKVRALGASNWSAERFVEANRYALNHGLKPFTVLQNQWSLVQPDWKDLDSPGAVRYVLDSEHSALVESGVLVAAYTSTASGFFATNGAKGGYTGDRAQRRLHATQHMAAKHGASPNQMALAYLLNHPVTTIPILGTLNLDHLQEAMEATHITLSQDEVFELEA